MNTIVPPISPPSTSRSFSPTPLETGLNHDHSAQLDTLTRANYNKRLVQMNSSLNASFFTESSIEGLGITKDNEEESHCYGFEGGNLNLRRREGRSSYISRNFILPKETELDEEEDDSTDPSDLSQLDLLIIKSSELLQTSSAILQTTLQTRESLRRFFDLETSLSALEQGLRSSFDVVEELEFEEGRVAEGVEHFFTGGSNNLDANLNSRNAGVVKNVLDGKPLRPDPRSLLRGPRRSRLSLSTISYGPTDLTAPNLDSSSNSKKDLEAVDNLGTYSFDSSAVTSPPNLPPKPLVMASAQLLSTVISKSNSTNSRSPSISNLRSFSPSLSSPSNYNYSLPSSSQKNSITPNFITSEESIPVASLPVHSSLSNFSPSQSQISTPPPTPKKSTHIRSRTSISPLALLSPSTSRVPLKSPESLTPPRQQHRRLISQPSVSSLATSSPAPSLSISLTSLESSLPEFEALLSPTPSLARTFSTSQNHPIPHSTPNGKGTGIEEDLRKINAKGGLLLSGGNEDFLKDRLVELKDSRRKSTIVVGGRGEGDEGTGSWWGWR